MRAAHWPHTNVACCVVLKLSQGAGGRLKFEAEQADLRAFANLLQCYKFADHCAAKALIV